MSCRTAELAEHATRAVRDLTHLTRFHDALDEPADLARLLAELTAMTSGLPQLLDQLDRWLQQEHEAAPLSADTDTDTGELVCSAASALTHAGNAARHLTAALDTAHEHLAHLATGQRRPTRTEQPNQGGQFSPVARGSIFSRC